MENDKTSVFKDGNSKYSCRERKHKHVGVKHKNNGTFMHHEKSGKEANEKNRNSDKNEPNTTSKDKDKITNLSSYSLNKSEISLLEKGLKFIPDRTKINMTKLLSDLAEWERRMRLREFFYEEDGRKEKIPDNEDDDKFRVKVKSNFTPKTGRDQWLDMYKMTLLTTSENQENLIPLETKGMRFSPYFRTQTL
jgi:hypothetical protein